MFESFVSTDSLMFKSILGKFSFFFCITCLGGTRKSQCKSWKDKSKKAELCSHYKVQMPISAPAVPSLESAFTELQEVLETWGESDFVKSCRGEIKCMCNFTELLVSSFSDMERLSCIDLNLRLGCDPFYLVRLFVLLENRWNNRESSIVAAPWLHPFTFCLFSRFYKMLWELLEL